MIMAIGLWRCRTRTEHFSGRLHELEVRVQLLSWWCQGEDDGDDDDDAEGEDNGDDEGKDDNDDEEGDDDGDEGKDDDEEDDDYDDDCISVNTWIKRPSPKPDTADDGQEGNKVGGWGW